MAKNTVTVDEKNLTHFTDNAQSWWDLSGPFRALHHLNPARISFITTFIQDHFSKDAFPCPLSVLDIGCGGGLVCEPMAKAGFQVTGLDAGLENIQVAKEHAQGQGLCIEYVCCAVEEYTPEKNFDIVLALEIVEHVTDVPMFLKECVRLLKPGGLLVLSTLNRTWKSFALGIVAAEWILRWAPKGTHHWEQFLKPHELIGFLRNLSVRPVQMKGLEYDPFTQNWRLTHNLDVNYILCAKKD